MPTLNELGKKVKAKYPGQYDALSDLEVGRRTRTKFPDAYTDYQEADTSRVTVRGHDRGKPKRLPTGGSSALPMLGGMAGGLRGGVGGAMAGGGAGEAIRQGIDLGSVQTPFAGTQLGSVLEGLMEPQNAPTSGSESLGRIANAGGEQGLYQVAGNVVGAGLGVAGQGAMQLGGKLLPEAAQTAIREGVTATRAGLQKTMNLIGRAGRDMQAAVRNAALRGVPRVLPAGARMNAQQIADQVMQATQRELRKQGIFGEDLSEVVELRRRFLRDNGRSMTLPRALEVKQASNSATRNLHQAVARNEPVRADTPVQQIWDREMERYLDERLGTVVPNYHEMNSRQSLLISLKDALQPVKKEPGVEAEVVRRGVPQLGRTIAGGVAGAGVGAAAPGDRGHNAEIGAIIGALAGNPAAMSMLGLLLSHQIPQAVARQAPRVLMQAAH